MATAVLEAPSEVESDHASTEADLVKLVDELAAAGAKNVPRQLAERIRFLRDSVAAQANAIHRPMSDIMDLAAQGRDLTVMQKHLKPRQGNFDEMAKQALAAQTLIASIIDGTVTSGVSSKEDIRAELDALIKEAVEQNWEVAFSLKTKTLSVTTSKVKLICKNDKKAPKEYLMGPYKIVLDYNSVDGLGRFHYHVEDLQDVPEGGWGGHPHLREEILCEGEGKVAIGAAMCALRFSDVFIMIYQVLCTYQPDAAYWQFHKGPRDGRFTCGDCGGRARSSRVVACRCGAQLCTDCAITCTCNGVVCGRCSAQCKARGCKRVSCGTCLKVCRSCNTSSCTEHTKRCTNCRQSSCANCLGDSEAGACKKCAEKLERLANNPTIGAAVGSIADAVLESRSNPPNWIMRSASDLHAFVNASILAASEEPITPESNDSQDFLAGAYIEEVARAVTEPPVFTAEDVSVTETVLVEEYAEDEDEDDDWADTDNDDDDDEESDDEDEDESDEEEDMEAAISSASESSDSDWNYGTSDDRPTAHDEDTIDG